MRKPVVTIVLVAVAASALGVLWGRSRPPGAHAGKADPAGATAHAHAGATFADSLDVQSFLRGNLHTHTLLSDGDSSPEEVVRWYREHGYAFLVITDHNQRTFPESLHELERPDFILLPGEEVTMRGADVPVHVNALCSKSTIGGHDFGSKEHALLWGVDRVREQGAIALINHPNFVAALDKPLILLGRKAELLEIHSGHPAVKSEGNNEMISEESLWQEALDEGAGFFGVAVDDMHHLKADGGRYPARPGKAWVEVFGTEIREKALCGALRSGHFYSSEGPQLSRLQVAGDTLSVAPAADATIEFLGAGGRVLSSVTATAAELVRYRVHGMSGMFAFD